jgi:glutamyl-tRNA reductase
MERMSRLVCLGLSHQTADVELRERMSGLTGDALRSPAIQELVVVSTCNRVELYAYLAPALEDSRSVVIDLVAQAQGIDQAQLTHHLYWHTGRAVVEHLCRVATGLESLVLGEPQILGQIGSAFQSAQQTKQTGAVLSTVFRIAIEAGKRARTETAISTNPASISSVAIALAHSIVGNFRHRRILVVGYGEMGRLTVKTLRSRGVTQIDLANRTVDKVSAVVEQWGGHAYGLDALDEALAHADILFTAASSAAPLLDAEMVQQAMTRRGRPTLVVIDLAVPRNVAPEVAALPGVHLFDVDDLRSSLDEALSARQRERPRVDAIISEEVAHCDRLLQELSMRPVILDLRQKAEEIRQREIERTLRSLGDVDPAVVNQIQVLSRALVNKLLHEPTVRLKQKASDEDVADYAAALRHLFGLEERLDVAGG